MRRRKFIQSTGTLAIGFCWWGTQALECYEENSDRGSDSPQAASLDSWLAIDSNGTVTFLTSKERS